MTNYSLDVARAAVSLAITSNRKDEEVLISKLKEQGILSAAADVGGDTITQTHVVIERAIKAARKNGLIKENPAQDGVVAGAAREAQTQVMLKAMGLNGGGKVAVCRKGGHLAVCIFLSIGMIYLNDVVIGLGHRVIESATED